MPFAMRVSGSCVVTMADCDMARMLAEGVWGWRGKLQSMAKLGPSISHVESPTPREPSHSAIFLVAPTAAVLARRRISGFEHRHDDLTVSFLPRDPRLNVRRRAAVRGCRSPAPLEAIWDPFSTTLSVSKLAAKADVMGFKERGRKRTNVAATEMVDGGRRNGNGC